MGVTPHSPPAISNDEFATDLIFGTSRPTGKPNSGSQKKDLSERVDSTAMSAFSNNPPVVSRSLGSRVWSVISFIFTPLYAIGNIIGGALSWIYDAVLGDDDEGEYHQSTIETNAKELKRIQTELKEIQRRQKSYDDKDALPNLGSLKELVKWLQLPQELDRLERDRASFVAAIAKFRESLKKNIDAVPRCQLDPEKNIEDQKREREELQKTFNEQLKQLNEIDGTFQRVPFLAENIRKKWSENLNKNIDQIEKAYQQAQQTTLGLLEGIQKGGKKVSDRKDLAAYYEYMSLSNLLKDLFTNLVQKNQACHHQIQKIARHLAKPLSDDIGLRNLNDLPYADRKGRGNTCWLNSALQAMRRTPSLVALIRNPIQRRIEAQESLKARQAQYVESVAKQSGETEEAFRMRKSRPVVSLSETDEQWNNRQAIHNVLNNVFNAMEEGDTEWIDRSVESLEHLLATLPDVPLELRENRGAQKDISYAFLCFLGVVDYKLAFKAHKITDDGKDEQLRDESELLWNFPVVGVNKGCPFVERLERGAKERVETNSGRYTKERRLSALPRFFITMANRFEGEAPVAPPELPKPLSSAHQARVDALLGPEPEVLAEVNKRLKRLDELEKQIALQKKEQSRAYGKKAEDLVEFPKDHIVDLSKSFLTADLPPNERLRAKFRLTSFPHHSGGLGGGHYTAYGRGQDGIWRYYNDSRVSQPGKKELDEQLSTSYLQVWELIDEGDQKELAQIDVVPAASATAKKS